MYTSVHTTPKPRTLQEEITETKSQPTGVERGGFVGSTGKRLCSFGKYSVKIKDVREDHRIGNNQPWQQGWKGFPEKAVPGHVLD